MKRRNTPDLPPYDIRRWSAQSLDVPHYALHEEFERIQHLPAYLTALERQHDAATLPTPYHNEILRLHLASQLEERARRVAERLNDFNHPGITDMERAFLVSFVGIAKTVTARNDQELYEAHDWRRYCMDVLRMANVAHMTIAHAANIQDGMENGYIPRVLKPWIIVNLQERYEQGDFSLERIDEE